MEYRYSSQSYDELDSVHGSVETAWSNLADRNLHILHPRKSCSSAVGAQSAHCPPLLAEYMRRTHASAQECNSAQAGDTGDRSSMCIEKTFDLEASAKSFVRGLANPCHPDLTDNSKTGRKVSAFLSSNDPLLHLFGEIHATPPTSSGSSSDESQSDYESIVVNKPPTLTRITKGDSKGKSKYRRWDHFAAVPKRQEVHSPVAAENDETMLSPRLSAPPSGCDLLFLVGNQQYLLSSSSMGLASKYVSQRKKVASAGLAIVDLSTHSPEEWKVVMEFLMPAAEPQGINWSNLTIVLPWFVEFQSLALLSEVDSFLLHNLLGGRRDGNQGRFINFPNLLKLTKIAIVCGLETTKVQARRFLRQGLLHPRKATAHTGGLVGGMEEHEDIELEWTLDDLQVLTRMMECYGELRDYLWEYAVIVYLPHDLDVSDPMVLVSNPLFPYLLREGMMQMMIVEGLDAASSPINELAHKLQKQNLSSSGSIGSDTTIPTNPASAVVKQQTRGEIQLHLHRIIQHIEKFEVEKDLRSIKQEQHSSEGFLTEDGASPREIRRRKTPKQAGPCPPAGLVRRPPESKADTFAC